MVQLTKEHQLNLQINELVEYTLRQKCFQSGIGFVKKMQTIPTSKQKYLLQMFTKDLVQPVTYYKNLNENLLKNDQQLLICTDSIVEYENLKEEDKKIDRSTVKEAIKIAAGKNKILARKSD